MTERTRRVWKGAGSRAALGRIEAFIVDWMENELEPVLLRKYRQYRGRTTLQTERKDEPCYRQEKCIYGFIAEREKIHHAGKGGAVV
jgi:hypothetical protein